MGRLILSFLAAAATTYLLAASFYTQQILARQAEIGAVYSFTQTLETYFINIQGLAGSYGLILAIGLVIAYPVAALVKRVLKPLALIAYPVAGATAVFAAIYLIENVVASGGVGALGGARGNSGLLLQCFAGFAGGVLFEWLRPKA